MKTFSFLLVFFYLIFTGMNCSSPAAKMKADSTLVGPNLFTGKNQFMYTSYNAKGDVNRKEIFDIRTVHTSNDTVTAEYFVHTESLFDTELPGGNNKYNLKSYLKTNSGIRLGMTEYYQYPLGVDKKSDLPGGGKYIINDSGLFYPKEIPQDKKLPDGMISVIARDSSEKIPATKITNRRFEAMDSCKTSAGTWSCYKISQDVQSIGPISGKVLHSTHEIEWFNFDVGLVRSESYDEQNAMIYRTELTSVSGN